MDKTVHLWTADRDLHGALSTITEQLLQLQLTNRDLEDLARSLHSVKEQLDHIDNLISDREGTLRAINNLQGRD